jgi:hypothetical protein
MAIGVCPFMVCPFWIVEASLCHDLETLQQHFYKTQKRFLGFFFLYCDLGLAHSWPAVAP